MKNGQRPTRLWRKFRWCSVSQVFLEQRPGGPPPKYGPGVVVHPVLRLGDLGRCYFVEAGTLWEEASDDPVHVLVAPSL